MIYRLLLVAFLTTLYCAKAQTIQPAVATAPGSWGIQKIFLTTDKVIYTPNEQLWFSAYLFENSLLVKDTTDVLILGLHDNISGNMVALKKFVLNNRITTGNLLLPDSLFAGDYTLVAYTNIVNSANNIPLGSAFKPLKIYNRTGDKSFTSTLRVADSLSTPGTLAVLHEMIPSSYQVTFKGAQAKYRITGSKARRLDLNEYGAGIIHVSEKELATAGNRALQVTTIYNGDTVHSRIKLPDPGQEVPAASQANTAEFTAAKIAGAKSFQLLLPRLVVNDSLNFEMRVDGRQQVRLILVDVNEVPSSHTVVLNDMKKVSMLLDDFPRGLSQLFIVDDSNRLLAKSYFFARYNRTGQLKIASSKEVYKTRDSVSLTLHLNNAEQQRLEGIATVSCALASRIDFTMLKTIEADYTLSSIGYSEPAFFKRQHILQQADLLEQLLKSKVPDDYFATHVNDNNAPLSTKKPETVLQLTRYGKHISKAMELVLMSDARLSILKTGEDGTLSLPNYSLVVKDGRKVYAKGMGKKSGDYYFLTTDSLVTAYKNLKIPIYQLPMPGAAADIASLLLTDKNERFSKTLETVVVKSKRDYGAMGTANPCGDYVCQNNILNCPNHVVPYKWPVKGQSYRSFSGMVVYNGCDYQDNLYIPATTLIYLPRTFLGMDSTLIKQEFPEYLSTLWWQPFKPIAKNAETKIVFNTSDQKGVYLVTVQGFAEDGQPFYGEKIIRVEE